jgi:serine/threonine protein kinase
MAYTFKHGDKPLEGFTIQRGIGRGGFGEVYYAISDGGREVALKYLRENADIELRGVTACMNLKSHHLVSIFDVKKNADGEYFIIMEHVAGPSLRDLLIAEPKGFGVEKSAFFLREIGKGLSYLHDRGIVHRDMKPANIFYEDGQVKIGDYGLSKFISVSRHSAQTSSVGTVHYMAPEVGSGNYTRGIDIYAMGVMLYEMLLGRVPFEGSSLGEVLMKHLTEQPEVDELPDPFGKVIRKALEKDPKDRYQTMDEMMDDVLEVGAVRDSLAGFNPVTITAVPRRPVPDAMHSPIPSPNPASPRPGGYAPAAAVDPNATLPPRVAHRVNRIGEKVERKLDKLSGRPHRRRHEPRVNVDGIRKASGRDITIALFMTAAASIGVGLLFSGKYREEVAVTAGMMVSATLGSILLGEKVVRWMGGTAQPMWVLRAVVAVCSAPLMAVAIAPMADWYGGEAFALLAGMIVVVVMSDWDTRIASGIRGEISFSRAFSLGLFGLISCAIAAGVLGFHPKSLLMWIGAATAASVSLLVEAVSWFVPRPGFSGVVATGSERQPERAGEDRTSAETVPRQPNAQPTPPMAPAHDSPGPIGGIPVGIPVQPGTLVSGFASLVPPPQRRSIVVRGFFSVLTLVTLVSVPATIGAAPVGNRQAPDDLMFGVVVAIAVFALLVFSIQKLSVTRRRGFWLETGCPLLISVAMVALGACIAVLSIYQLRDAEIVVAVSGAAGLGIILLLLIIARFTPRSNLDQRYQTFDPAGARAEFLGIAQRAGDAGENRQDPGTAEPSA